jgi:translation initiation factor IF-2
VRLELIHSAVGPVTESDVLLASASNAVIIGFGSKIDSGAAEMAKREGVQIKLYRIIYELIDQVKEAMAGLLDPEIRTKVLGQVEIKQIFNVSKGKVAGCIVLSGLIQRNAKVRLLRNKNILWEGQLTTLKRFQDDVAEVRTGLECGIRLGNYTEFEAGEIIEAFETEKISQKL